MIVALEAFINASFHKRTKNRKDYCINYSTETLIRAVGLANQNLKH